MRGIGYGFKRHVERQFLAGTHDAEPRGAADRLGGKAILEGIGVLDLQSIDGSDEVAGLEARARGGTRWRHAGDQRAGWTLESQTVGNFGRYPLQSRAKPRTPDRGAAALCRGDHDLHHVRRNGETDALRAARAGEDRRIDADEAPGEVDQRAT